MATKSDLAFWQKQVDRDCLIEAIRNYRERAVIFFGAIAVLTENKGSLFRTLEAQMIVSISDSDLLNKMNQEMASGLEKSSPTVLESHRGGMLFKHSDIAALKQKAQQHLCSVLGLSEQSKI